MKTERVITGIGSEGNMFIAFDGIDGAGKNTLIESVGKYLTGNGRIVHKLDFGGAAGFRDYLQAMNHGELKVQKEIRELLYYYEGLFTNLNVIRKVPKEEFVLIDRYYLSYYAYGQMNGFSYKEIQYYTQNLIEPDLYFYLDIDENTTFSRITQYREIEPPEIGFTETKEKDRSQVFLAFQRAVRENYLDALKPGHIIIDATRERKAVLDDIIHEIQRIL